MEIYKKSEIFLVSLQHTEKFQIYSKEEGEVKILGIREWLKREFGLENEEVISQAEQLAEKWYECL